ncbi:MAG: type V CRISPR-associated protein Cas12b [Verrucomicrobia bacterium]|nr:type V CRISPR-associated protein Cas12b [Verrucomicrobiota bacterium]
MNRIYQGKVSRVEIPDGKDENGQAKWKQLDNWESALWQQHELFQDAVNYYTLGLAAMAEGLESEGFARSWIKHAAQRASADPKHKNETDREKAAEDARQAARVKIKAALDWREQVCHSWLKARRKAVEFPGPHALVACWLDLDLDQSGFDDCVAKVLESTPSSPEQRAAAFLQLLEEADTRDLNQLCVDRIAPLCSPSGKCDATPKEVAAGQAAKMLSAVHRLHSYAGQDWENIAAGIEPGWFITRMPDKLLRGAEAQKEAVKRFKMASEDDPLLKEHAEAFAKRMRERGDALSVFTPGRKVKGPYSVAVVFKLWPCLHSAEALKRSTVGFLKQKPPETTPDAILAARVNDTPVFDYFTNRALVREPDNDDRAVWFEFDLAAFLEAIKSPHRYFQDTLKRDAVARQLREQLHAIDPEGGWLKPAAAEEASKKKPKPTDFGADEEETAGFTFAGDARIALLRRLVTDDKEGIAWLAEAETPGGASEKAEYTIQERTLRGWPKIREAWRKLSARQDWPRLAPKEQEDKLWAAVAVEQGEHRDDFGSATLYKALARPMYHPIWRDPPARPGEHADDPLRVWLQFTERRFELQNKERPIRFTPAHAERSPRYFIIPKTGRFGSEHLRGEIAFTAGVVLETEGVLEPKLVRLSYGSPRLRRDQLRSDNETDLTAAPWLQPMMQALGLPEPNLTDFANCRVTLQPAAPDDIQLTFPVEVATDKMVAQFGNHGRWAKQFNLHPDGQEFHEATLRWPHEKQPAKPPIPWHATLNSFTCLPVDLGQRDAGAYALLRASANPAQDFGQKPSRFIGPANPDDMPGKQWRVALAAAGMLRLSGEDREEWRARTRLDDLNTDDHEAGPDFREELFGERGRSATPAETQECANLLAAFAVNEDELMPDCWRDSLSFPEQNDKLLIAARRAQSRVARLHRWCWFLAGGNKARNVEKALEEILEAEDDRIAPAACRALAKDGLRAKLLVTLKRELAARLRTLPRLLETLANRCLPLRARSWQWDSHPAKADCFILDRTGPARPNARMTMPDGKVVDVTWIRGQRGLSLERIEQIEELRRRFQSLNQTLRRDLGGPPPKRRDDSIPDPCPALLNKLDELKTQRVNQTAHPILAQALGVRLAKPPANKSQLRRDRDQHGVYERFRAPVDFIVIEDLSRYRASQGRAPSENSRLMKWCHRAVRDKLKELCEPFGLPVLETPAAYSSRFCARCGVPGFRAVEVHPGLKQDFPWGWLLARLKRHHQNPEQFPLIDEARAESERVERLFQQLDELNDDRLKEQELARRAGRPFRPKWRTLLAPMAGGPIFVPICEVVASPDDPKLQPAVVQADINAAINLGLRAIADPRVWAIHSRLRTQREEKGGGLLAREKRKFGEKVKVKLAVAGPGASDAGDTRNPNFFADFAGLQALAETLAQENPRDRGLTNHWQSAQLDGDSQPIALMHGRSFWGTVKAAQWKRINALNAARIAAWCDKLDPMPD